MADIQDARASGQFARRAAPAGKGGRQAREAASHRWPRTVLSLRGRRRVEGERPIVEGAPAAATLSRDSLFKRALLLCDVASGALAFLFASLVLPAPPSAGLALGALPLLVLVNKLSGLYDRDELRLCRTTLEEAPGLFQAATLYSLLVGVGTRVLDPGVSGHAQVIALWPTLFASMLVTRACVRRVLNATVRPERCLVLGYSTAAPRVASSLARTSGASAEVVGRLPMESAFEARDARVDGNAGGSKLLNELTELRVDRVILVPGFSDSEALLDAVREVKSLGVKVSVVPQLFEVVGSSVSVDDIEGLLLLGVRNHGLTNSSHALKRSFDAVVAGAGLIVLAPLLGMSAALTALGSRSWPLQRDPRQDRGGRPFEMLSLRITAGRAGEMVETPVGRLLRHGGLHMLPRLWNVVVGDMSLVGPRPLALRESGPDTDAAPTPLRPGLTGLWLTTGAAEPTVHEDQKLDYLYSSNWSAWFDVRILLRSLALAGAQSTPAAALHRRWIEPRVEKYREPAPNGAAPKGATPKGVVQHARVNGRRRIGTAKIPSDAGLRLSVIVPATDTPECLERCLSAISECPEAPDEIVVVDDAEAGRPGAARNAGAGMATGSVLVFVDSDVAVHPDVFKRIREVFEADPGLTALFGSYDDDPEAPGAVSSFRNLLHHHVHQNAGGPASTFWTGLGAIRREAFEEAGGFDPSHPIEDIELGMRLSKAGARIQLDPDVHCKHLKAWTLRGMLMTDLSVRGAPWVELMLRHRGASSTLNLGWRHRLSAAACLLGLGGVAMRRSSVSVGATLSLVALNHSFYSLLLRRRGMRQAGAGVGLHALHLLVAVAAVPAGVARHLRTRRAEVARGGAPERREQERVSPPDRSA